MRYASITSFKVWFPRQASSGFTILEMVIAMLVAGLAMTAAYTSYNVQEKSFAVQRDAARMEASLRAAMQAIKSDLRNAGRCGQKNESACGFKFIQDTKRYDFHDGAMAMAGFAGIQNLVLNMGQDQFDKNGNPTRDGKADLDPWGAPFRTIQYRVRDVDGNGTRELYRIDSAAPPGAGTLVADGIYDMAFAFAFDNDNGGRGDGRLDRLPAAVAGDPDTIIWAIDSDADGSNKLDLNLDSVPDKIIDYRDDQDNSNHEIDFGDGGQLPTPVSLRKVRAVRIWLLARSSREYRGYMDNKPNGYQVGHRTYIPSVNGVDGDDNDQDGIDNHRYLLLESSVHLRNTEP